MALSAVAPSALASIDGQDINIASTSEVVKASINRLTAGVGFTLFTLNLDHLVKRRSDPAFRSAYGRATFVTADGAPVVWLARKQGVRIDRVTGADLVIPMCEAAAREGIPVAFYGSSTQSLARAAANLRRMFPRIKINFLEAPPQGFNPTSPAADDAARRMAAAGARICFIALGAPKQEAFADRMGARHPNLGFLGIGAALDFIAGDQVRAPKFFQNHGLEWAWRLASNPQRMAIRYARCAAVLAMIALIPTQARAPHFGRAPSLGPTTR